MSELSRSQFPPQGWTYYQPQTGWTAPTPLASSFDQTVILIIRMRQANPAITVRHKLPTDVVSVGNELEAYTRLRLGMPPANTVPKMPPPASLPQMSGAVQASVAAVKKLAQGMALLLEWEESGLAPVAAELSAARAAVCVECPKNGSGSLTEIFTVPASEKIKARLQRLHALALHTPHDEKLNVCQACLCPLKLKVHTPMELIKKRLKPEQIAELDHRCWILTGN